MVMSERRSRVNSGLNARAVAAATSPSKQLGRLGSAVLWGFLRLRCTGGRELRCDVSHRTVLHGFELRAGTGSSFWREMKGQWWTSSKIHLFS